jgi:GGDEF domain-containing protein
LQESLRGGNFCTEQTLNLPVRASMGLATFPNDAQTPHDIIRQADEMMYVVKNTTRDNIGVASRGMVET